jgi:hypothetical protein
MARQLLVIMVSASSSLCTMHTTFHIFNSNFCWQCQLCSKHLGNGMILVFYLLKNHYCTLLIGDWFPYRYDRNKLAAPSNMDFTKLQRVNYAFFQTDTSGNIWGTDSWGDPNVLFGPYNWNPSDSSKEFCSWDSPTDRPCNYHKYEEGLIHLVHAAGAELYPSLGGWTLSGTSFVFLCLIAVRFGMLILKVISLLRSFPRHGCGSCC